jgi:UDP-N-acetylmuramoylalanine--D-glutamate ligase
MKSFRNQKILVVGLGITGVATARLLASLGARVTISDTASADQLAPAIATLSDLDIEWSLGGHQTDCFTAAEGIVISPGVPWDLAPLGQARQAGIPVIGEMELAAGLISIPLVAVTGTNGKTTTTTLIGEMLAASGLKVFVGGNIGTPLCNYLLDQRDDDVAVIEVSSFQLDTIDTFNPTVAVILNISADHLDRYDDMTAYAASKAKIFHNQGPRQVAILNAADPWIRPMSAQINGRQLFFNAATDDTAGIQLIDGRIVWRGLTAANLPMLDRQVLDQVVRSLEGYDFADWSLPGPHNRENACAAILAALAAGATADGIQRALVTFKGLPHRLQFVARIQGISFYNDSKATNPDAVLRAVQSFAQPLVLIMGGQNKALPMESLQAVVDHSTVRQLVVMGETGPALMNRFADQIAVSQALTMQEAVYQAHRLAAPGETVLLAPAYASFDCYPNYAARGEAFHRAVKQLQEEIDSGVRQQA